MSSEQPERMERLTRMLKQRGVILPAFEIHGGSKGLYDFGPIGGRLRNKVNQMWLEHWTSLGNIVEISCPTVTPYEVLEASGHVGEFSDYMTTCGACGESSRADTLLESFHPNPDSLSKSDLEKLLFDSNPSCPSCGKIEWSKVTAQNLMFNTKIGAGQSGRDGFLRPETAQGMFTNFPAIYRHFRERLPFGAVQVGKGYRNEISPRQGMIRLREFNMAELEYFIDPEAEIEHDFSDWNEKIVLISENHGEVEMTIKQAVDQSIIRHPTVGFFMAHTHDLLVKLGIHRDKLRFRQHESDEMAHYATDCWDAEIHGMHGWIECVGIAHRGCYDLEAHEKSTGKSLRAWRSFEKPVTREIDRWTIEGAKAGPAFRSLAGKVKQAVEGLPAQTEFPIQITLDSGESVEVLPEHVKREQETETVSGEWFIPHVVEPAFGIDRIIWHILDHAWTETKKQGQEYSVLSLEPDIAPIDVSVFPLFEKDGMDALAKQIHLKLCSTKGVFSSYDASGSIGRRYARADEVGVPVCITVDHQSLEDETVTLRDRDTGEQNRCKISDLPFLN